MRTGFKRIKLFIYSILSFIIILALVLSYLILSLQPFRAELSGDMSISSMFELRKKINKEIKLIFSFEQPEERKITLTKTEINTAFDLYAGVNQFGAVFGSKEESSDKFQLIKVIFQEGMFSLFVSRKLFSAGSYSAYLNIEADIVPSVSDDKIAVTILKLKCGDIRIPASLLNRVVQSRESQINNLRAVREILKCVKELKVENSSLSIIYYPKKLVEYFPDLKRVKL